MNTVKALAIDKALRLLNASGCKYFVLTKKVKLTVNCQPQKNQNNHESTNRD